MSRRHFPSLPSQNPPQADQVRSGSSTTRNPSSRASVIENRKSNFVLSLCMGTCFFVLGVVVGFTMAVYDHETTDLSWGVGACLFVIFAASLRLPIVYQLILPEPTTKWRDDRSGSLYVAIALVGLSSGLLLPAEFMLIEIIISNPAELEWDRGGWIAIVALAFPVLVGLVACIGDLRHEAEEREKWLRVRRSRARAKKYGGTAGNKSSDR